jgi:hypothetical protein
MQARLRAFESRERTEKLKALLKANTQRVKISFLGITWECQKPANDELNETLIMVGVDLINASQRNEESYRLASSHATEPPRLDGSSDNQILDESARWFRRNPSKKDSTNS